MFRFSIFRPMDDLFASRFEPDGDGYIFRSTFRSPGIRVTADERGRFVRDYGRNARILLWSMVAITMLAIGLLIWGGETYWPDATLPTWYPLVVTILMIGLITPLSLWLNAAPDRAVRGRAIAAPAYPKEHYERLAHARLSWGKLALGLALLPLVVWRLSGGDVLHGWNRLWLLVMAAYVGLIGYRAYRKWRIESRPTVAHPT